MKIEILPLGDCAILVNFEQKIDPLIHQQVVVLADIIQTANMPGVSFIQPAYCSLAIGYQPSLISYPELLKYIRSVRIDVHGTQDTGRMITCPVCYEGHFALDMDNISNRTGLTSEEIIDLHTSEIYRVYLLGFLPGFPYLGILPDQLHLPRMDDPRIRVPERSIGIAGKQTGIYPFDSPGGWNIMGSTPLPVFDSTNNEEFLFQTGDLVKFRPIDLPEYEEIRGQLSKNVFEWDSIYG